MMEKSNNFDKVSFLADLPNIDQLCTPCLPAGLVRTESGFIVRSVETGLGR